MMLCTSRSCKYSTTSSRRRIQAHVIHVHVMCARACYVHMHVQLHVHVQLQVQVQVQVQVHARWRGHGHGHGHMPWPTRPHARWPARRAGYASVKPLTTAESSVFLDFMKLTMLCNATWRFKNFNIDHREIAECRDAHRVRLS